MPFDEVFQPLNVNLSRVNEFAGRVVFTPLATVTLEIEPVPEFALKEIVLGVIE